MGINRYVLLLNFCNIDFVNLWNTINEMPTLFKVFGLRFFFYSNEHEPIHVHVRNADGEAKFNVETMQWVDNKGVKNKDLKLAEALIEENKDLIIKSWHNYFNK